MSKLSDLNVNEFCKGLASGDPTPGGGSASALSGANAAALLAMYCRLTIGRKKYADVEKTMTEAAELLDKVRDRMIELIDEDSNAYSKVMAAFKMPKETDEDKAARKAAIEDGTKAAAEVPFEVCNLSVRLLEVARKINGLGNPNALSDAGVGVQLAFAAFAGAALNVYINLNSLSDQAYIDKMRHQMHQLENVARAVSAEVAGDIYVKLNVH